MRSAALLAVIFCFIGLAYVLAEQNKQRPHQLKHIQIGMNEQQLSSHFGAPANKNRNELTYILDDYSKLTVTLRDQVLASAKIKFHRPLKLEDPQLKQLTLVQMEMANSDTQPSWFFAGNPAEGLIYKITAQGVIESITWIKPFSYGQQRPRQLNALFRDFRIQRTLDL